MQLPDLENIPPATYEISVLGQTIKEDFPFIPPAAHLHNLLAVVEASELEYKNGGVGDLPHNFDVFLLLFIGSIIHTFEHMHLELTRTSLTTSHNGCDAANDINTWSESVVKAVIFEKYIGDLSSQYSDFRTSGVSCDALAKALSATIERNGIDWLQHRVKLPKELFNPS